MPYPSQPVATELPPLSRKRGSQPFQRFSPGSFLLIFGLTVLYLLWTGLLIGFRPDHFIVLAICLVGYYTHPTSRRFVLGFSLFVLYGLAYDSLRVYPNYLANAVHIRQPYELEKAWFGIRSGAGWVTPNEYFRAHTTTFLDVLSGFFYVNWLPVPFLFAFFLFVRDKFTYLRFSLAFILTNVVGWVVYYLYPAAPPWYVEQYGFTSQFNIPGSVAGLQGFDDFFGVRIFQGIYARSSNVFAAMPSLHSAFPVVVLFYGLKEKLGWINGFFALFVLGIWFSAVYTRHHYLVDVMAGAACAVFTLLIFEGLLSKTRFFTRLRQFSRQLE